jgi:hypothetical protein
MAILVVAVAFVLALLAQHRPGAFTSQTCGGAGVRRDDVIAERRPVICRPARSNCAKRSRQACRSGWASRRMAPWRHQASHP